MALKKAIIYVYRKQPPPDKIYVQFNPSEYSISESTQYKKKHANKGKEPGSQFVARGAAQLQVTLHFDTYMKEMDESAFTMAMLGISSSIERDDVRSLTGKITDLMVADSGTQAPPKVLFSWGSLGFFGTVSSVTQKFTMFMDDGKPVRAQIDLTITSEPDTDGVSESQQVKMPDALDLPATVANGDDWKMAMKSFQAMNPRLLL